MDHAVIGGVEGGGTHSKLVLFDSRGKIISRINGPGTNHFLIGMEECRKRIAEMTVRAKKDAGLPEDVPLSALGLSLSGCENEDGNQEIVRGFLESYPALSERYAIGSDTQGSIAATSSKGGITCIAGTGSNTLLINPDGSKFQCGGWGHLLGDEGGAWKIAMRAIKICFDDNDGFEAAPFATDRIFSIIKEHFKVESLVDLLDYFYTRFDKSYIAAMCRKLSVCANEGDELSRFIFKEAGGHLARALAAVIAKASMELFNRNGGLHILCVGSVWSSWNLLEPGFVEWTRGHSSVKELSLMKLTTTMAVGAAYMAADQLHIELPRDYEHNYTVFYHYQNHL